MDEQAKRKIAEDLQKAGFAAELAAMSQLVASEWLAFAGYRYHDQDEDKERDVDINAFFELTEAIGDGAVSFQTRLIADVKKSEQPWVVLRKPHSFEYVEHEVGRSVLADANNLKNDFKLLPFELSREWVAMDSGWIGRGVHESFKKPQDFSRSYVAFGSICKACEAVMTNFRDENATGGNAVVQHLQAALILDGPLASVFLKDTGELQIAEEKWATVAFRQKSKMLRHGFYHIDVVTLQHLAEYLALLEKRSSEVFRRYMTLGYFNP